MGGAVCGNPIALSDNLQGFFKDFSTCSITNAYKKYIGAFAIEIAPADASKVQIYQIPCVLAHQFFLPISRECLNAVNNGLW